MRKLLLAIAAFAMLCCFGSADAQVVMMPQQPVPMVVTQPVIVSAPAAPIRVNRAPRRGRFLGAVIEFEQRKNAWFRRTFLRR